MRKISYLLMLLTLVLSFAIPMESASAAGVTTSRISGDDRFQVAVNVAEAGWKTSPVVFLANYLSFADALSATPYAYKLQAPILLTKPDTLTDTTKAEITKLGATKVIIVGGPASVSDKVIQELESMGIAAANITRIGGADRYQVAENVAAKMGSFSKAIVTNGLEFADSLSIAPYAAMYGDPILLTKSSSVPAYTQAALKGHDNVLVVGGSGSVSSDVYKQIGADQRIDGANRYEVAANVIKQLGMKTDKVFVATGLKFADALTGSVLAAKDGAPLLLTRTDKIPAPVEAITADKDINNYTVLGGPASVSPFVSSVLGETVVLDPGHGGSDYGAIVDNTTIYEKNINLAVGLDTRDYLESLGVHVVMTRDVDGHLTNGFSLGKGFIVADGLQNRVDIGVANHGDIFVSIHANTCSCTSAYGTRPFFHVYTAPDPNPTTLHTQESTDLAQAIGNEMVKEAGMSDGVPRTDGSPTYIGYHVLRENPLPSTLIELGFLTNSQDLDKLNSPDWQKKAGRAISQGIFDYFQTH